MCIVFVLLFFFFQAEDGIRDFCLSRGLGDVYKRQAKELPEPVIDRIEYDLKDELIRQTIMDTQEDVEAMRDQLDKIDERLYEIQKNKSVSYTHLTLPTKRIV